MSGRLISGRRAGTPADHTCEPPRDALVALPTRTNPRQPVPDSRWVPYVPTARVVLATRPSYEVGAVWLCDCGTAWVVRNEPTPPVGHGRGYSPGRGGPRWYRAGWLKTRRARRAAADPNALPRRLDDMTAKVDR